jgi:hypothetical protein
MCVVCCIVCCVICACRALRFVLCDHMCVSCVVYADAQRDQMGSLPESHKQTILLQWKKKKVALAQRRSSHSTPPYLPQQLSLRACAVCGVRCARARACVHVRLIFAPPTQRGAGANQTSFAAESLRAVSSRGLDSSAGQCCAPQPPGRTGQALPRASRQRWQYAPFSFLFSFLTIIMFTFIINLYVFVYFYSITFS